VRLKPGESQVLEFPLGPEELSMPKRGGGWTVPGGAYRVFVGSSSVGGLTAEFRQK
jgi:hypothetical protein